MNRTDNARSMIWKVLYWLGLYFFRKKSQKDKKSLRWKVQKKKSQKDKKSKREKVEKAKRWKKMKIENVKKIKSQDTPYMHRNTEKSLFHLRCVRLVSLGWFNMWSSHWTAPKSILKYFNWETVLLPRGEKSFKLRPYKGISSGKKRILGEELKKVPRVDWFQLCSD